MRPAADRYDAVVVGSGFGGAMAAHLLVQAGWRVLLLERGEWPCRDELDWSPQAVLIQQRYRSGSPLLVKQYGAKRFSQVYPSALVGGMSVLYGGASLRLREQDFRQWPLTYAELEPWYSRAEQLLGVHGQAGRDPCDPPRSAGYPFPTVELTPPARRLCEAALKLGYRPSRIPLAINFCDPARPRCVQCDTCDGFPCKIQAKNDLAVSLLRPAQARGLEIATGAIVCRLREKKGEIQGVICKDRNSGQEYEVAGQVVILAAGALQSPAILLRSGMDRFPHQRLIGRFLMRHCNAVVSGIFPFATNPQQVFHKQLCFAEFYEDLRDRFGTATGVIQDIYTPAPEVIRHHAPRGLKQVAGFFARCMQNLLCIAEDEPRPENRVYLSRERDAWGVELVVVEHAYTPSDCERRNYLVERAKKILRRAGGLLSYVYPIDTFSHALGTVRFGRSPEESALDPDCRFWGVENLFVVDGSFMPTSGGVNPSLTIAANALRVADRIIAGGRR